MVDKNIADKLASIASQQFSMGLKAKDRRMKDVVDIMDLYNNKVLQMEDNVTNIPFPIMAAQIDTAFSKIDNPPSCSFKLPNKKLLSEKVAAAWDQEKSSMKAGWSRKDRAEKKLALFSGRGIAKVYASSLNNKYKSHYEVVDPLSFIADPTRGHLEDGVYHGETDIFKTKTSLKKMAEIGVYDKKQVDKLLSLKDDEADQVIKGKFNRLKSLGIDTPTGAFEGQDGVLMTEWVMKYEDQWFYLFFEPNSKIWVRAEKLEDVFNSKKTPYVSWATHYDEFSFWTKGYGDDIYPVAEAMRLILNTVIENEKRRSRPMRIVEAGSLMDVNELMDYVPDNVILTNPSKSPNIIDVQTPQISASINVVDFLNNFMSDKTGVSGQGVAEQDAKVGVYYGQLQQEADRYGIVNKSYSESYAEKGYRFFWGLKQHLTDSKAIEMLGKGGVRLEELKSVELNDVDDVDDIITSGGQAQEELDAIQNRQQADALASLTGNPVYAQKLNPNWVIKTTLKKAAFEDDSINEAMDTQSDINIELMQEADEAIASVLEGVMPKLNQGATPAFMERIFDYVRDNIDYVKIDKDGNVTGIDKEMKKKSDRLLAYMAAHQEIVFRNVNRAAQEQVSQQRALETASNEQVNIPAPTQTQQRQAVARPFEEAQGTPQGTAEASQVISGELSL